MFLMPGKKIENWFHITFDNEMNVNLDLDRRKPGKKDEFEIRQKSQFSILFGISPQSTLCWIGQKCR